MDGLTSATPQSVIPPTGLTVVVDPGQPCLDIVFVHGFKGHPERTWTHKNNSEPSEPPHKVRRINAFSNLRHARADGHSAPIFWPRDLLSPIVPDARVLTYGYDTKIQHWSGPPVSTHTVYDIAGDFLVALEARRRDEPQRPVIFIAHSLGGIIVKEMLRRSSHGHRAQTHLQSIFESTVGIMFFGTPHGGADPRGLLLRVAEKVVRAAGFNVNEQVVNSLLPASERLKELRDAFGPIAQERKWVIHSFQEQYGSRALLGRKVVEDESSYLNLPGIETTEHIGRDHMHMSRFTGPDDPEFCKVEAALRRMMTTASRRGRTSQTGATSLNDEQRKALLDSLRFDQIDSRHMTIKIAYAKTCRWLLRKSEYLEWLDPAKLSQHHGFLWVKGKPGTGKSTLMKFASGNARKSMKDKLIISFFFNARGDDLEKSTVGMYRSLLLQLLERLPVLQSAFDSLGLTSWNGGYQKWTIESLKGVFEQAIRNLEESSVVCYIDALDECDEYQIRDMVSFFEHIGEIAVSAKLGFRVCFSSRHYPHITMKYGLSLILEGQEGHGQDIAKYVDTELKIGHSNLAEQVRIELQEKASGVFMWIVLVVEILNKEHDGGRIHTLRQRLREIPGDLHELIRDILTRDQRHKDELLLCIQWVLFARTPLKPEQLYFAILSGIIPNDLTAWDPNEISIDDIKRFILNSSKGLAEVTRSKTPTIQFIHESVRDFLLKENGLGSIWPELGHNLEGKSHEQLKQCCVNYSSLDVSDRLDLGEALPKASSEQGKAFRQAATDAFPFLEYAVRNLLYHADTAGNLSIEQGDFIGNFHLARWIKLNNIFEVHQLRRYSNPSLLYILAEANVSHLIQIHPSVLSCIEVEDERYGCPLLAAMATESRNALEAFRKALVMSLPPDSPIRRQCDQNNEARHYRLNLGRGFKFLKHRDLLSYLMQNDDDEFIAPLLEAGKLFSGFQDEGDSRTLLRWAAWKGQEATAKLLLETGKVDPDSRDDNGRTPLLWAAVFGKTSIAKLLLETGKVDSDSRDIDGRTPLSWAASCGHEATAKLLLETGKVDPDSKDDIGWTPLLWAALDGHEAIVKLLLETGKVDPDSRDNSGRTPRGCFI